MRAAARSSIVGARCAYPSAVGGVAGGSVNLDGVQDASARLGEMWARDPALTLKGMRLMLLVLTVLGGVLGLVLGNWLGDDGLWVSSAKVFSPLGGPAVPCPAISAG